MILNDDFKILYENDSTSNYLVLSTNVDKELLNYQSQMLLHNKLTGLLNFNINRIGDEINCFYNITSKCTLAAFLSRKSFKRDEFLKTILNIINNIYQLKSFLLYDSNILLDENFVYVEPDSIDIYFVYLPFAECKNNIKDFFTKIIFQLVKFNDEYSDNYLQKILQVLKSEQFSLNSFKSTIESLLCDDLKENARLKEKNQLNVNIEENIKQTTERPIIKKATQGKTLFSWIDQNKLENDKDKKAIKVKNELHNELHADKFKNEMLKGEETYNGVEVKKANIRIPINKNIEKHQNTNQFLNSINLNHDQENNHVFQATKDINKTNKTNLLKLIMILFQPILIICMVLVLTSDFVKQSDNQTTTVIILILIFLAVDILIIRLLNDKLKVSNEAYTQENETAEIGDKSLQIISSRMKAKSEQKNEAFYSNRLEQPIEASQNYNGETVIIKHPKLAENPYLKAKEGNDIIQINKSSILIGRMESFVDYVINSSAIGKIHAEIIHDGKDVYIMDCNSKNGTYLNDNRILPNTKNKIQSNDILRFANKEYEFYNCVQENISSIS